MVDDPSLRHEADVVEQLVCLVRLVWLGFLFNWVGRSIGMFRLSSGHAIARGEMGTTAARGGGFR